MSNDRSAGQRPPLACRPSPPQGGRWGGRSAFANLQRCRKDGKAEAANLPPCGGDGRQARGGREGTRTLPPFVIVPIKPLLIPLGQMAVLREVEEAGELALEAESHCAGRTMALLGDNDLGLAARLVHLVLPLHVFGRAGLWLLVPQ